MSELPEGVEDAERIARDAATTEDALAALHAAAFSPITAIHGLYRGRGLSLADAKRALHSSPAWSKEAKAAEALHDDALRAVERMESIDRVGHPRVRYGSEDDDDQGWGQP